MVHENVAFSAKEDICTNSDDEDDNGSNSIAKKYSYWPIGLLFGLYYVVFTLVIPALPALTLQLENDDSSTAAYLYGLATFVRYIVEFFCAPILGNLTDIYGRKLFLCISFAICAVEFALLAMFPSIAMVFASRAMSGAFDSGLPTSYTIITDIATFNKDSITTAYGLVSAISGLGYIIGPLLGGILCGINLSLCFYTAAGLSICGLILSVVLLPESLSLNSDGVSTRISSVEKETEKWNPIPALMLHFQNTELRRLTFPLALSSLNLGLGAIWYIYMAHRYNANATEIGVYMSFFGAVSAVILGVFIKYLIPNIWSEQTACVYGFYLLAVQYVAYGVSPWQIGLYVAVLLFTVGMVSDPALKALIVQSSLRQNPNSKENCQGNLQGVLMSIRTLANAFGSLIFSSIYGYSVSVNPELPFLAFVLGGLLYAISGAYLHFLFRSEKSISSKDQLVYTQVDMEESLLQNNHDN